MAAPKGNQFWKLASKHGRDKLFATPELLWEAACEYFEWCSEHPWNRVDFKGKDNEEVLIPTERPFTMSGLCLYLNCGEAYFRSFKHDLKGKTDKLSIEFATVIARIQEVVYTQQFEGATVGAYDSRIISRALGLAEPVRISGDSDNPIQSKLTIEILPASGKIASNESDIED